MKHIITTTILGGDLSGTFKNITVSKLKNLTLDMSAISDGRILAFNSNANNIGLINIPTGEYRVGESFSSNTLVINTTVNGFHYLDISYTIPEAGNYFIRFMACARDDSSGNRVVINMETNLAGALNGVPNSYRDVGSMGSGARQINQNIVSHGYLENVAVNTLIRIKVSSTTGVDLFNTAGTLVFDQRSLTVIKI
jgi:hypothetical protein